MRRRLLVGLGVGCVLAGCMIDLEPPLASSAGPGPDSGASDALAPADARPDAPEGPSCTTASDCHAEGFGASCLTPRCDDGTCVFDICPSGDTCSAARCDLDAGACTAAAPVPFAAGQVAVSTSVPFGELPCGVLGRCVAAAYPFLFVVDGQSSVSGYVVANGAEPLPRRVGVDPLDVAPAAIVANGHRVFYVGAPSGPLQAMRLRIGWFDVPANPFAASIPIASVDVDYRASSADVPALLPAPDGDLYVVSGHETFRFHPGTSDDVTLIRPLPDNGAVAIVASTGDRLAAAGVDGSGASTFALLVNAGTPTAGFGGAVSTTGALGTIGNGDLAVASGPANEVVALAASGPAQPDASVPIAKARVAWIVEPNASTVTATAGIDLATYAPALPAGTRATGPIGVVSAGAFTLRTNQAQTATTAEVVARNDDGGAPFVRAGRSATLPGSPGSYVVLTTADWVYAVSSAAATLNVAVFQPACD